MRVSLTFYRVMAYIVGCLLVVLVCVGIPLQIWGGNPSVVDVTGTMHGFLYMTLIISAVNLGQRIRWPWWRIIIIALAGTIPFVTFVAEHFATKDARVRIPLMEERKRQKAAEAEAEAAADS